MTINDKFKASMKHQLEIQMEHEMGGCHNYGPFLGYYNKAPKRDHNFDN